MDFHLGQRVIAVDTIGDVIAGHFYVIRDTHGVGVTIQGSGNFLYHHKRFVPAPILYKRQPHEPHIQSRTTSYMHQQ